MRRSILPVTRFLLAVSFLAAGSGRAFGIVPCPHHESHPASESGHEATAHHSAAHQGHSDHGQPSEHEAPCTCVGACQAGAPLAAPPVGPAGIVPAPVSQSGPGLAPIDDPRPAHALHLLPYSTAPPAGR